jgi:hypothetical protein
MGGIADQLAAPDAPLTEPRGELMHEVFRLDALFSAIGRYDFMLLVADEILRLREELRVARGGA